MKAKTNENTKPVCAIYCRVSTDVQRERHTINSQLRILPDVAKKSGWKIYNTYEDDGFSAETVEGRPAFQKLLEDAEAKLFDVVLVVDLDRLTRSKSSAQGALIFDLLRENNIKIATPFEIIDLTNEDQDFMAGIKREVAKWEKRKIARRMRRGKVTNVKDGKSPGGNHPLGYKWNGEKFVVDPKQADVVRLIFDLCLQGMGCGAIMKYLVKNKVKTHSAFKVEEMLERHKRNPTKYPKPQLKVGKWEQRQVWNILQRKTYYTGDRAMDGFGGTYKLKPIITKEVFEQAQIELQKRKQYDRGQEKKYHERLCKGITFCGHCGRMMHPHCIPKKTKDLDYYICGARNVDTSACPDSRRIRVDQLDKEVWDRFIEMIKDPATFESVLRGMAQDADKQALTNRIKSLEKTINLNHAKIKDFIRAELYQGEFQADIDSLRRESAGIQQIIDNLQAQLSQEKEVDEGIKAAQKYFYQQLRVDVARHLMLQAVKAINGSKEEATSNPVIEAIMHKLQNIDVRNIKNKRLQSKVQHLQVKCKRLRDIQNEKSALEALVRQIESIDEAIAATDNFIKDSEELVKTMEGLVNNEELAEQMEKLAFEQKRDLLRKFADGIHTKILVYNKKDGFKIDIQGKLEIPVDSGKERLNGNKSSLKITQ